MIIQEAIIHHIIFEHSHEYIEKVKSKWFDGDLRALLGVIVTIQLGAKKAPTYTNVKGCIEQATELKDFLRESMLQTLDRLKNTTYILPDDPIGQIRKHYDLKQIMKLKTIDKLEYESKKELVRKVADALESDIEEKRVHNMQDKMNELVDNFITGEGNMLMQHSIKLNNPMLRTIWGDYIYPVPYCIMARPADFKTSLLIELSIDFWRQNKKGIFFSMEDNVDRLRCKYIGNMKAIPIQTLMNTTKSEALAHQIGKAENKKMQVIDKNQSIKTFRSEVEALTKTYQVDYIILDYIQLFSGEKDETAKLTYISREFMYICKDYNIPIIFTSQVTVPETDKQQNNSALHMGHVKGAKAISENCRHMVSLFGDKTTSERTLAVIKNSYGGCGNKTIGFDGPTGRLMYAH